ncbi:hypothetical protein Moror_6951 [Moniliophthora roreri MCA 2997]|uniref:DUF7330 domain-containing protein n=1 Tax=Moniliophthora roreri (strain MCA 2997) TaxID=1381753 RepID=V2XB71_MONRO|nr:hypothetical protein Moror_6951 [Moniliophthora roreri MCA 2997]
MILVSDEHPEVFDAASKQAEAQQERERVQVEADDPGITYVHDAPPPPYVPPATAARDSIPSSVKPSNYVLIHQKNSAVRGIYGINASLQIPGTLVPLPAEAESPGELRKNLEIASKNGGVDAEVHIVSDAKPCDGRKKVTLETRSSNGSVTTKLHRSGSSSPPIALSSYSHNGSVHVRIPRSFRGTLYLTSCHGNAKLSEGVSGQATLLRDSEGTKRYLIGEFDGAEDGDEVHAETKNGSVRVMYIDETVDSVLKGLVGMLSRFF